MESQFCYHCRQAIASATGSHCSTCGVQTVIRERYRILSVLGRGGFGVVYRVYDQRLQRFCALKVVHSTSRLEQQQLETEAKILAQHASQLSFLPDIYDSWSEGAETYLLMEFIEGRTIDRLTDGPWPAAEVERFLRALLAHLAQLHAADVIHRDLKPKNIMRASDGRYVLIDFGIAKRGDVTLSGARAALSLAYASPEQLQGRQTDDRSDLYSLAATAFFLLTGVLPVSATARLQSAATLVAPSALVGGVPPHLERALLAMLALNPAERPLDADAALALLDAEDGLPAGRARLDLTVRSRLLSPVSRQALRLVLLLVVPLLLGGGVWLAVAGRVDQAPLPAKDLAARTPSIAAAPIGTSRPAEEALPVGRVAVVREAMAPVLWAEPGGGEQVTERPRLYSGALVTILEHTPSAVRVRTPEQVEGWLRLPAEQVLTGDLSVVGEAALLTPGARVMVSWPRGIPLRAEPASTAQRLLDVLEAGSEGTIQELRGDWLLLQLDSGISGWARWYYDGARYIETIGR